MVSVLNFLQLGLFQTKSIFQTGLINTRLIVFYWNACKKSKLSNLTEKCNLILLIPCHTQNLLPGFFPNLWGKFFQKQRIEKVFYFYYESCIRFLYQTAWIDNGGQSEDSGTFSFVSFSNRTLAVIFNCIFNIPSVLGRCFVDVKC